MKSEQSIEERLRLPETLRSRKRIKQLILGAGALASLGIGTVWYMSSCDKTDKQEQIAAEVAQPVELTAEQKAIDNHIANAKIALTRVAEEGYTREELLNAVIPGYENLKGIEDKVKHSSILKTHFGQVVGAYKQVIDEAFDASDVFGYVGCVNHKASGNRRANYGGVKPLLVGKGKDVADLEDIFTEEVKIELLKKSRAKWAPYTVRNDVIPEKEVYSTSLPFTSKKFKKVLDARKSFGKRNDSTSRFMNETTWEALIDGSSEFNAELIKDGEQTRFMAIYNGHPSE